MLTPAVTFHSHVFGPALVLGVAAVGLYGILAVALVLTYRVSRTIGFVQGGIAVFATFLYARLTVGPHLDDPVRMGRIPAALIVLAVGTAMGTVYGLTVTGKRMANWPRILITTYSLGGLLLLAGLAITVIPVEERRAPSIFGKGVVRMVGSVLTVHQVATVALLVGLVALLSFMLRRTRTGIHIRAIADDVEASRYLGIPLNRVGTGVYSLAGAISAMAGVLLAAAVGTNPPNILFVFLRALVVTVLGGFTSLSLALAGCVLLGVGETMLTAGVFGVVPSDRRELILMSLIFGLVFLINKLRPIRVIEATGL